MSPLLPSDAATSTGRADVAPLPTTVVTTDVRRLRRARLGRRCVIAALSVLVLAGLLGLLGDRATTARTADERTALEVTWPAITRGGLPAPLQIEVQRTGGFDGQVVIEVGSELLTIFDEHGLDPEPAAATSDGETVTWSFDPPDGDRLTVEFDGRIEPGRFGHVASSVVLRRRGDTPLRVATTTWIVP
jgi:hypothetical protein